MYITRLKKRGSIQDGYRKSVVFSQTLMDGNSKNEKRWRKKEGKKRSKYIVNSKVGMKEKSLMNLN